jgi:hypothetical protein
MADLLVREKHMDLAEQRSQQALALFEELAKPASSLGTQLANTRRLNDWLLRYGGQKKR